MTRSILLNASWTDPDGVAWTFSQEFSPGPDSRQIRLVATATPAESRRVLHWSGPTLLAGDGTFGGHKTDAIFPGLEYLLEDEPSSSTAYAAPKFANRTVPHPYKVTIPLMAVSHQWPRGRHPLGPTPGLRRRLAPPVRRLLLPERPRRRRQSPPRPLRPRHPPLPRRERAGGPPPARLRPEDARPPRSQPRRPCQRRIDRRGKGLGRDLRACPTSRCRTPLRKTSTSASAPTSMSPGTRTPRAGTTPWPTPGDRATSTASSPNSGATASGRRATRSSAPAPAIRSVAASPGQSPTTKGSQTRPSAGPRPTWNSRSTTATSPPPLPAPGSRSQTCSPPRTPTAPGSGSPT